MNKLRTRVPWLAIPIAAILGFTSANFAGLSLSLPYLLIPFAAYLGRHYGPKSLIAIAVGSTIPPVLLWLELYYPLPLAALAIPAGTVISYAQLNEAFGSLELLAGVYSVSLLVCWFSAAPAPLERIERAFQSRSLALAVTVTLPFCVGLWQEDLGGGYKFAAWFDLFPLLLAFMFVFGVAGLNVPFVIRVLAVVTSVGLFVDLLGMPMDAREAVPNLWTRMLSPFLAEGKTVNYSLRAPVDFFVAVAYFLTGNYVRRLTSDESSQSRVWRHPYLVVALLMVLWLGTARSQCPDSRMLATALDHSFSILGAYHALPLAGVVAGLLLGVRGMWWAIALSMIVPMMNFAIGTVTFGEGVEGNATLFSYRLESPLICAAYGSLGIQLAGRGKHRAAPPLSAQGRWFAAVIVLALITGPGQEFFLDALSFAREELVSGALSLDKEKFTAAIFVLLVLGLAAWSLVKFLTSTRQLINDLFDLVDRTDFLTTRLRRVVVLSKELLRKVVAFWRRTPPQQPKNGTQS